MTTLAGVVWGIEGASYVYAIVVRESIYFGETGDLPPKRWGGHLADGGTLRQKLRLFDLESEKPSPYFFAAVHCAAIEHVDPRLRKLARRAVEEELHRRFLLDRAALYPVQVLLSSMPPSPIRLTFSFDARTIAGEAYNLICDSFRAWLEKLNRM
ncbi:hypothetical protein ACU4GI_47790 [Cupriavidus basilensis]